MSDLIRQEFGARVRSLREGCGISLRKFALMVDVDKSYLINIELGRRAPSLDVIEKIAAGLDVSLPDLFKGVEVHLSRQNDTHH